MEILVLGKLESFQKEYLEVGKPAAQTGFVSIWLEKSPSPAVIRSFLNNLFRLLLENELGVQQ